MSLEILIAFYKKEETEEKIVSQLKKVYPTIEIEKADLSKILGEIRKKRSEKKKILLLIKDDILEDLLVTIETIKRQFDIPIVAIHQKKYEGVTMNGTYFIAYFSKGIEKEVEEAIEKYK